MLVLDGPILFHQWGRIVHLTNLPLTWRGRILYQDSKLLWRKSRDNWLGKVLRKELNGALLLARHLKGGVTIPSTVISNLFKNNQVKGSKRQFL
jgi:hypothetical protein